MLFCKLWFGPYWRFIRIVFAKRRQRCQCWHLVRTISYNFCNFNSSADIEERWWPLYLTSVIARTTARYVSARNLLSWHVWWKFGYIFSYFMTPLSLLQGSGWPFLQQCFYIWVLDCNISNIHFQVSAYTRRVLSRVHWHRIAIITQITFALLSLKRDLFVRCVVDRLILVASLRTTVYVL